MLSLSLSLCKFWAVFGLQSTKTRDSVNPFIESTHRRLLTMDDRIFELRDNLLTHLDQNWTVKEMAKKAGLSLSRFPVVFKAILKSPPAGYLKNARLEAAKELLEQDAYIQIKQICVKFHFGSESHFTRDFKNKYHKNPTEHRRESQENRQANLLKQLAEIKNGQE